MVQTRFSPAQLAEPHMATSESVIRRCVHCGFCTATCPTYVLLGDELDSPRGRIHLIKEMLEGERTPSAEVVKHVDRCLSCLACQTTCPSGVDYGRLVDHARAYIEDRYRRPLFDRLLRGALAWTLPHPARLRVALTVARLARPLSGAFAGIPALRPVSAMLDLAPRRAAPRAPRPAPSQATARPRVAILQGCAEPVLNPQIRAATLRLLDRMGLDAILAPGDACCGALPHHMGREAQALDFARRNVEAWTREIEGGGLMAIVVTASGCGSVVKDYGFMLKDDPAYADKAARVSALACDVTELVDRAGLPRVVRPGGLRVAYHAACSLQHGQQVRTEPRRLLAAAGFEVLEPAEAHLCCGSAGTYNILQPQIAGQLGKRKAAALEAVRPDVIAAGNIGCLTQIAGKTGVPVVHTIELLDWATGGPAPAGVG